MFGLKYYILKNKKVVEAKDMDEWAHFFEDNKRRVARTQVSKHVSVSTVFLGMDHGYSGGPPIVFETMIFGGRHDEEMERYATWEDAEEGHERMVKRAIGFRKWFKWFLKYDEKEVN